MAPCASRSAISTYTLGAKPMLTTITAMPRLARRSMGLRPNRSAAWPQIGEKIAETMKVTPKAIPENCAIKAGLSTPRRLM